MKSLLISIKPKWTAKILNGEKTIEVRKSFPKCDLPIDVYIYCTKEEELFYNKDTKKWFTTKNRKNVKRLSNGVVKAKFTLRNVEEIRFDLCNKEWFIESIETEKELLIKSCLTQNELDNYLDGQRGYAWHIDNLVIFDKPKELSEFNALQRAKATDCGYLKQCKNCGKRFNRCHLLKPLAKAPQSFMFIESENENEIY